MDVALLLVWSPGYWYTSFVVQLSNNCELKCPEYVAHCHVIFSVFQFITLPPSTVQ